MQESKIKNSINKIISPTPVYSQNMVKSMMAKNKITPKGLQRKNQILLRKRPSKQRRLYAFLLR